MSSKHFEQIDGLDSALHYRFPVNEEQFSLNSPTRSKIGIETTPIKFHSNPISCQAVTGLRRVPLAVVHPLEHANHLKECQQIADDRKAGLDH
jgi:hypothetical protein